MKSALYVWTVDVCNFFNTLPQYFEMLCLVWASLLN